MARGNDAEQARREMAEKYPSTAQGAAQDLSAMIQAANERTDPELVRASGHRLDDKAMEDLDLDSLEVPEGFERVVSAAVRDGKIIAVVERSSDDEGLPAHLRGVREKVVLGEVRGGQRGSRQRQSDEGQRENLRAQGKSPESQQQ